MLSENGKAQHLIKPKASVKKLGAADLMIIGDQKIYFSGNSFFSVKELKSKLFRFDDSGFFEPHLVMNELVELYKNHGFLDAHITFDCYDEVGNNVVVFEIDEGVRYSISKVLISGNYDRSSFAEFIEHLFDELQPTYIDNTFLTTFLAKLKEHFARHGFWDLTIHEYRCIPTEKGICDLLLKIDQGRQKLLQDVIIQNNTELHIDQMNIPETDLNIPFDKSLIETYKQNIANVVMPIDPSIQINHEVKSYENETDNRTSNSRLIIALTKKNAYVGKLIINGCIKTDPEAIRRYLALKEGDSWDLNKIELSLKKLRDLKLFKSISIVPANLFDGDEKKTVLVNIVEDSNLELITKCGFAQTSGFSAHPLLGYVPNLNYKLGASLVWKNIAELADVLKVDIDYSGYSTTFAASYKRPFISDVLGKMTLNAQVFNNQLDQPLPGIVGKSNARAYGEKHTGVRFELDMPLSNVNIFLSSALDYIKVSSLKHDSFNILHIDPDFFSKRILYGIVEPSIVYNTFDNEIEPTKGFKTSLHLKAMIPLHDLSHSFLKVVGEHAHVFPLSINSSLAIKLRAGYIFNQRIETILPTERFYLGGLQTIRAYELNMAPPVTRFNIEADQVQNSSSILAIPASARASVISIPLGAKAMLNLNTEWRCKLYDKLSGVVFNDMGLLKRSAFHHFSLQDIVGATGFGLRYATPVGTIRFDIGFKWRRQLEEKPYNWYLTFGQSF